MYSMQEVLDPQFLSTEYTKVSSISQSIPFFDFFVPSGSEENYAGDQIEMPRFAGERRAAPSNKRGSPARTLNVNAGEKVLAVPIHFFNEITLPRDCLRYLREPASPAVQNKGVTEISRHLRDFGYRQKVAKAVHLSKLMFNGIIYYGFDGGILESSSNAELTMDFSMGATHQDQLAHASNGSSDIIDIAWDSASALIMRDLDQIRVAAEYDMVPEPRHVWCPVVMKQWIRANTELKSFIVLNSPRAEEFLVGPGDTLEFPSQRWTFHFSAQTYIGADGSTVRDLIPATKVLITPDPTDGNWLTKYATDEDVPTQEGIAGSVAEANAQIQSVFGDFAYLRNTTNPPKLSLFLGTNFHYGLADVNAIWQPTVDF